MDADIPIVPLLAWDITAYPGSSGSIPAIPKAEGVTGGALTLGAGLAEAAVAGSLNTTGWDEWTALAADRTAYYTFSVSADATHSIFVGGVFGSFVSKDPDGPLRWGVYCEDDGFSQPIGGWTAFPGNPAVYPLGAGLSRTVPANGTLEFRIMTRDEAVSFDRETPATNTAVVRLADINASSHFGLTGKVFSV